MTSVTLIGSEPTAQSGEPETTPVVVSAPAAPKAKRTRKAAEPSPETSPETAPAAAVGGYSFTIVDN